MRECRFDRIGCEPQPDGRSDVLRLGYVLVLMCASSVAFAVSAQEGPIGPACWSDYADCARGSEGDENWRSICYAHFTECLGRQALSQCPGERRLKACLDYSKECKALAEGDPVWVSQCAEDQDACNLAHGC